MRKSGSHAFVHHLLIAALVTIGFGGSVGLGTVWLRHQISVTANHNRQLAELIKQTERQIAEQLILVESEQNPELLRRRNADWQLGLALPGEAQLVHVTEDPVRRLAARAGRELLNDRPLLAGFRVAAGP